MRVGLLHAARSRVSDASKIRRRVRWDLLGTSEEADAPSFPDRRVSDLLNISAKRGWSNCRDRRAAYGTVVVSGSLMVFSTSIEQSAIRALNAPIAAATGAITAPI